MNKIGSRQIIEILNTKINENESIESQLKNLFTTWRGEIVLRSSWRGRISTFVTHPTEVKATHRKICGIVAKALIEAPVESVKYTPETLKFLKWAQQKDLYHPTDAVAAAFETAKEIRELGEAAAKAKLDSFKIHEGSLLFEPLSPDQIVLSLVDQKRFFELSQSSELTEDDFNFIETYLNQHPEVAAEGWRGRLAKMRAQIVRGEELTEEFAGASETARPALLKREAELLREQVLNLTAESGQTLVHLQKYGSRCSATQKLGTILSNLPDSVLMEFPEKLREIIKSRTKPTPREMAEALVNIFAEGESQPQVEEQGEPSFLLPNDERELTGTFAQYLPDIFEDYVSQAMRDGAIVAGVGLTGYKEVQLLLRWLLQNGQALSSADTNSAFKEVVIRGIEQILTNFEQPVLNRADSVLKNAFSKIGNSLPGMLFELSGIEGLFLNGEIWFEFQRQTDGNFSLSLYTTGHGLNFHPNAKQKDQKKFCLKLDNIDPGKLNPQFFELLMRRNWESAWNPEFASEAHTIYDTLLPLLGGTYSKSNDRLQHISVNPSEAHNAFTTASHLLMKREGVDRDFVFDRMWEHLLDYCKKNCVKEDSLSLTEADIVHLEPILKTLMNRLGNLKEHDSYKDEIPQIELVLADLHRVILIGHRVDTGKAVSEFDGLENSIKSALSNLGLSFERLEQLESLLEWFLGPEVEKFMSPMIAEAKRLLPEKTAQAEKKPAKSNFKGSYATIYLNLAWQVAKMTMLAAGIYAGGVWSLLSIPTLLAVLPYILPKEHYQYYCDTMSAVRYSMAKMVFEFCWNHLFSEETKESFKQLQALPLLHMQRMDQPKETIPEPAVIPEEIVPVVVQPNPVVNVQQFLTAENLEDWVRRAEEDDFDFKSFCESLLNEHLELSQFEWRKHRNPEGAYALIHRLQNLINKSNSETSLDYLLLFSAECYLSILKCNVSEAKSRFQVLDDFVPQTHKNAMYEQRKKFTELGDEERFFETNLEEISYRLNACYQALLAEKIFPSYVRSNRGVITPKRCEETRLSVRITPQLTPENLINWSDQVSHEDNWETIVGAIRGLPLPSESDRWNHLQDTESTMKAISDISRLLLQKKDDCHRKEDKIDVILAHYRLIALGQAVCRMPSDSGVVKHPLQEGSGIDCTLLLELIYSWQFNSFNPRVHDEIVVILGQLMPEFDLAHPPTYYQEILDLNKDKLWPSDAFCPLEAEYRERLNIEIHENGIERFDFSKPVRYLKRMVKVASVEIMRFHDSVGYKNKHGRNLLEGRIQTINTTDPKFMLSVSQPTEMVQDLINLYTTQPELFDRNVFLERLSVPGILIKAIKQNPALVDAIVEMIQKLRASKAASRTVYTLFDTFKLLEFAQQMEGFCCYCYPESKDKFQFIDEFALAIKEKKYQDRNNLIDLLKIAMERMPADPSTVLDRSVRIDCLSKLLCNAVFIDDKEFNHSRWDLWRHELVNLFQGDDEELKSAVLRAFYRENGLSDQDIEKAIEDYEFVYDEDEEKLEIYGSGSKQFRVDIAPKFGGFEQLKSLIGDSEFRSLRLVDRFTLASQNGRCVYRFLPLDVPSGDDSFLYQIQMEIKRADGQTEIYRPYKLNKQAIKPGAVPTLQRILNPSYMCWMELFEGEGNEPKIDRKRNFRICVIDSNTVLHQHGTIGEIEKRLYEDPQPVATVTATVPTSVSTKRVELTAEQSKQYPGYSVAPQQYHQAIAGMPQTILLKSDEGKYKVLVPAKNTFLTMFGALTRFDVVSGPLVKKMMEKIGRYFDNDETKNYYAFDIVTDEQGVHKLVSADENKGLAYLMIYHLYRFDFKAAEEVCQEIVRLYSQGPIPADYWPEIKYLLIPFMSPQMAQYRWRVISAQQMNQTLHPVGGAKPSDSKLFPLLMNGLILSDLLSFVDNPEARNCLSPLQEYHLYRYLINHLVEFLRENLPESERLQAFVNAEFIETLFECPPFDQAAFTKRYAQLKYELGVFDENTNMKMFKWAYRFTMTPANLYEYKGEETAYQPQTTMKSNPIIKGIQALRKIKSISKSKAIGLDTQKLLEEIQPRNYNYLDIDVNSFSIDVVKKNFILYYELLHGDIEIPRGAPPDTKQRLLNVLLLNKGCGDVATQRLTEILLHVANAPGVFPPAIELIRTQCRALQDVENGLEKWKELIGHLWELVILQEICHNALVPAMEKLAVSMTLGNVVASHAAPFYGNSQLVNMTVNKVRENVSETLNEWSGRYVEQITTLMTGKLTAVSPTTVMAGVSAATGLVFMGNMVYMVANTVLGFMGSQQVNPEVVEEEEPSGIYSWMKSLAPLIPVGLMAGNAAFAYWSKRKVTVSDVLPALPANIVTLCAKAKNLWLETRREQREKFRLTAAQRTVRVDLSLESLKEQEDDINAFLKEMFDLAYSEDFSPLQNPAEAVKLTPVNPDDPFEVERVQRVNDSIDTFYRERGERKVIYRLKDDRDFGRMAVQLQMFHYSLEKTIQAEKAALESVLRKDFESIRKLVDKEGTIPFDLSTGLTEADRPKIRLAIARINLQESRRAQIKQQLDYVTQLLGCDIAQKPALYYDLANKLAIGLRVKTEYELSDKNLRLAYVCAQIEASKGMKFRKDQIEKILEVNAQRNEKGEINTVSDLPPAAGKSSFVLPAEMAQLADGEQLVMPMIPTTLAGDGMRLIDVQSQQAFNRLTYKLIFERERHLDISTLKDLLAIVNGAKNNHEFIQMTKEDALTLRSIFFEKCDEYDKTPSKERKRALILLHRILSVPYHNGVCLPDETHETYAHKKQLNFPLGKEVTLNVDYCLTIETVMKQAVACEELQKAFFENETCFFDTKKYDEVYKPKIAAKIADSKLIKIKGEARKKEFIAFVCDELDYVPAWMEKHKDQFEKISIVKGVLSDLLPRCFKNRAGVNYGRKQSDKTEFARPSDGNNGASVTDCLKNPFEAYVKTIMLIFAEGLSVAQTRKLLLKLKASALAEIEKTGLPYEKTAVGHRFGAILTKEMLNGINDFAVHQVHRKYKRDPNLCLLYTRKVIRPQIKYWKENIENNSQDFGSMFKSSISCTGTPYNDGTYPAWMTMLRDSKTIGQLLDIVTRKLKGISILEKSKPMEVLDEMITTYFGVGSKFSALIDGGALFTGLSNETVAEKLFEHCKKNRPDITAVKFYKEDNNGVEQLYCFTRNHRGPVLVSSVNIPLDECITYYDQRHGFGADIKQAGDGLETMGPNHPLFKWLQELFRIRELKNDTMLETWRNDLLKEQKIQIVMTKDVQKLILESSGNVSNHVPTLKEILQYTVKNEAAIAEEENYSSMLGKIHTVPVKATYGKILDTRSEDFEDWFRVFKDHRDLFITQVQDDPTVLFGRVKKITPVQDALKSAKKNSKHIVAKSPHFSAEERSAIKDELRNLKQPTLPVNVTVSLDSSGDLDDKSTSSSCFGETMQFATKNEQRDEVDEEQNQQQELNQDQNVSQTAPHRGDFNYKPAPFAKDFNPNRYQDFKFEGSAALQRTLLLRAKATCPLFKVRSLLKAASNVLLNKCASDFDPRLWMTNNMVPRHVVNLETAIDIGSHHQLALKECLVHFKVVNGEVKILSMGAVSLDDAAAIRLKLKDQPESEVKTVLWHHGLIMAGDSSYQQMLEDCEDFQMLMAQLKILDGQTSFKKEEAALIKWLRNSKVSAIADLVDHITVEKDVRLSETHLDGILNLENPDHLLVDDL